MTTKRTALCLLLIGVLFFNTTVIAIPFARGDEVQRLKDEIVQRNSRLTEIEKEISENEIKHHSVQGTSPKLGDAENDEDDDCGDC